VASRFDLHVGGYYEFTLQGAQRWVRIVRIRSLYPDAVVIGLDNGAQLTVPYAAILSARPVPPGAGPVPPGACPVPPGAGPVPPAGPVAAGPVPPVTGPVPPAGRVSAGRAAEDRGPADGSEAVYLRHRDHHGSNFSASWLRDFRATLLREGGGSQDGLAAVAVPVAEALEAVAGQWTENDFERHDRAYRSSRQCLQAAATALDSAARAGHPPPGYLRALLSQLSEAVEAENSEHVLSSASSPDFVGLAAREHFYVQDDQTFLLTVSVGLPAGDAPVESVQLLVGSSSEVRPMGPAGFLRQLRPGEAREVVQRLKVSDLALGVGQAGISLSLRYRRASGLVEETAVRSMEAILEPARKFVTVANPYSRYSGGTPVEERDMFFGRRELLERIYSEISDGPLGQCFLLYGQKRSGKSSVLRQLEHRLHHPNLPIYLSLGAIDTNEPERSFIQLCIDSLYQKLVFDFDMTDVLEEHWPGQRQVATSPIASFRKSVLASARLLQARKNWRLVRPVFLVDEFTYVFEYIREGLLTPAFMRQWKSLLESRTFDAVLVGQDTMPRFKEAYPNEFGVTHDERISYLSAAEARELAEQPIMLQGESRYKGNSLDRLIRLTAGSPFYLQIFCDRLVQHLNRQRLVFITESVVKDVLRQLVTGHVALSADKFDPLITAAGESVALAPRAQYLALLTRLALRPTASRDVPAGEAPLVQDLLDREVLERGSGGLLLIRVGLFAEWLRANSVGGAG
jgi:hypothetical protein